MKKIRKCCVIVLLVVLFPANIFAQERRDKEQTYVLENPYEVNKITPLQGKKIKNVVLMIGDGMSLMPYILLGRLIVVNFFWIIVRLWGFRKPTVQIN